MIHCDSYRNRSRQNRGTERFQKRWRINDQMRLSCYSAAMEPRLHSSLSLSEKCARFFIERIFRFFYHRRVIRVSIFWIAWRRELPNPKLILCTSMEFREETNSWGESKLMICANCPRCQATVLTPSKKRTEEIKRKGKGPSLYSFWRLKSWKVSSLGFGN